MAASEPEVTANGGDRDGIIRAANALAESLPQTAARDAADREGLAVAAIVEELGLPADVIAAARLCPLLRANLIDDETLNNNDLSSISSILHELLQLSEFTLPADWTPGEALAVEQSEALRKMLLAVVSDVRLVLARIAEQLFRLREAKSASSERQQALAIEAREVYAALASRLGVWQLKWELEDLAFRYLDADTYSSIARALNEKRGERERFIERVKALLDEELGREGIEATISGRPKHIYSIFRKMQRKDRDMDSLYDIRAVRVLVDSVSDCYAALGVVHKLWPYLPGEFDDYIANPKDNDYRSLHTAVVGPEGKSFEVQIRTHDMHRQAELGVAAHWRYKEGGGQPAAFDRKIRFLRQLLEPGDDGSELLDQIRDDVFEDRVYALSPKGDVVELPAGATPLDFAYHVHTQVGHRCRGAKANGRIVPLTYKVQNGDQIEIITGSQPQPSRDWLSPRLGYIAGPRTRAKVRSWFRQQDREQHLRQGREILDRELSRLSERDVPTDTVARQLKQKDTESLCVLLGAGEITAAAIATALQQLRGTELDRPARVRKSRPRDNRPDGVAVSGVGDLMCNFARCCRPVPPEPVTGYITQGRGVTIHRADCGNCLNLARSHPERIIEVAWGQSESNAYPVDLSLLAYDRSGLLRDITQVLTDEGVNIVELDLKTDREHMQSMISLGIEIPDLPTLSTTISRLEQLSNVVSVKRKA